MLTMATNLKEKSFRESVMPNTYPASIRNRTESISPSDYPIVKLKFQYNIVHVYNIVQ